MKLNLAETKSCNLKLQSDVEFMKDKVICYTYLQ